MKSSQSFEGGEDMLPGSAGRPGLFQDQKCSIAGVYRVEEEWVRGKQGQTI